MRARMLLSLTLGAFLPCLGAGCASTAISGQGGTTTSGNRLLAFLAQPKAKTSAAAQRNDPTSLFSKSAKPGPELFVTMAQLREQAGDVAEAETLYQRALKADPKSLPALMGYAHLEDRRGNLEAATKLYKKAVNKHPNEVAPYNDLGLCFHRQGKLNESAQTLRRAVEMQPDKKLYRNNLAMVLVDLDRNDEALKELSIAGSPASAHYNLASLLHRKGDDATALDHFRQALALDPSMQPAEQWIAKLAPELSPMYADSLLAGRLRQRTADNSEPQASAVASNGETSPPPPAAVQAPPGRTPLRSPIARPVSTRTVKSAPAIESNQEAAPRAPSQPPFLYANDTPNAPPTASGNEAGRAPPAPELGSDDRTPAPQTITRPEGTPAVESRPQTRGASSNLAGAPQAPNPPQFLYADRTPYAPRTALGNETSSAPPAPELGSTDRTPAPQTIARPERAPAVESVPESRSAGSNLVGAPHSPNPPQFLYADETPYAPPQAAPNDSNPVPPDAENNAAEKTKLSLASDRPAGARIVKTPPEIKNAGSSRGGAALSLNPPLYLHADEPVAAEPVASEPVFAKPVSVEPVAGEPAAAKPVASKPVASKPVAAKLTAERTKAVRLQYPDRHQDSERSTSGEAPLPGDEPLLDAAMSPEDEVENPALIVPAEPNNYGG